jgi:hypothetical protein
MALYAGLYNYLNFKASISSMPHMSFDEWLFEQQYYDLVDYSVLRINDHVSFEWESLPPFDMDRLRKELNKTGHTYVKGRNYKFLGHNAIPRWISDLGMQLMYK